MPKCIKCHSSQSKLNTGALCKPCFNKKMNPAELMEPSDIEAINTKEDDSNSFLMTSQENERNIYVVIKDNIIKEKSWNDEIRTILKDQVVFLKQEIIAKNTLIESLIDELYKRGAGRSSRSEVEDDTNSIRSPQLLTLIMIVTYLKLSVIRYLQKEGKLALVCRRK